LAETDRQSDKNIDNSTQTIKSIKEVITVYDCLSINTRMVSRQWVVGWMRERVPLSLLLGGPWCLLETSEFVHAKSHLFIWKWRILVYS